MYIFRSWNGIWEILDLEHLVTKGSEVKVGWSPPGKWLGVPHPGTGA